MEKSDRNKSRFDEIIKDMEAQDKLWLANRLLENVSLSIYSAKEMQEESIIFRRGKAVGQIWGALQALYNVEANFVALRVLAK